jgi:hypothetical protein
MLLSLVQICTAMVSQILTTCPVLIFLERNTQCFHPIVTTFIILTMVVGSICLSFDFYVPPTGVLPDKVYVSSVAFCTTAYVLIMFICVVAFAQYVYVYTKRADKGGAAHVDVFEEFSVSAVPAYHMVALFFVSGLNVVWSNFPPLPVITTFDSSLFAVVNLTRFLSIDAESALHAATTKFEKRFRAMEGALPGGRMFKDLSSTEMNNLWEEAKTREVKTPEKRA